MSDRPRSSGTAGRTRDDRLAADLTGSDPGPDASVGTLIGELTTEFGELVSAHVQLAKVEITEEVRRAGRGAGLLSGGAVAGILALIFLSGAAAWGLAEAVPEGVAFLIVGLVWVGIAAGLAAGGRRELERVDGPRETIDELEEDQRWLHRQTN